MQNQPQLTAAPSGQVNDPATWRIEGALVISTVADWHRHLTERLTAVPECAIDLGGVTAVDTFGLQLLLAAQRSATAGGRRLTLTAIPPVFDEACAAIGLSRAALSTPQS